MVRWEFAGIAVALAASLVGACALFTDLSGFDSEQSAPGNPDSAAAGTGDAAAEETGDGGGGPDAGTDAEAGCRGTKGPTPVRVGSYCIDATEVTVAQYREFMSAKGEDMSGQPAECSWNASYVPFEMLGEARPVHGPDWCDAFMYCQWAGKRLCGKLGGGPTPQSLLDNALSDEWYKACSKDGSQEYPYGQSFQRNACMVQDAGPATVASHPVCEGGYPGIFDMGGNLWEWENSCSPGAATADCVIRGGSYARDNTDSCRAIGSRPRNRGGSMDVTIRCCSDLN